MTSNQPPLRHFLSSTLLALLLSSCLPAMAAKADQRAVTDEIIRHADNFDLTIGLAAVHLESGKRVVLNGDTRFPLASTYKIPMAAYALHLVGTGRLTLDQLIEVRQKDLVISSSITRLFPHPGIHLSLLNLMEATLIQSDNTATDVLLRTIGGGPAVTDWLESQDIRDMRVDRSTADLIGDYMGMPRSDGETSMATRYRALSFDELTAADWSTLYDRLLADPRDQGSPLAMLQLLTGIWQDSYLSAEYGQALRAIMSRCLTGSDRLSGLLPAQQLPLANKTGTLGGTVNDVGVIELPDQRGTIIMAVFVKGRSTLDVKAGERAIAEVSRTLYDYFLFSED